MRVPKYNYRAQFAGELDGVVSDIARMLATGAYVLSDEVLRFEEQYAALLGVPHVAGTNSGTDALILALMALGVGRGDQVLTQANTFYATVAAIRLVGASPILVDAEEESFLINSDTVASAMTSRVRAIIPVHLYGKPTPMVPLLALAEKYDSFVVEDAAQSHGARRDGKFAGTSGTIGCFSFHPSKNLAAAGDAGAVVTSTAALDDRIRVLRGLGQRHQNDHIAIGLNSKLDGIQARILLSKLPKLLAWNERRRTIAAQYRDTLRDLPLRFQATDDSEEHAFHLFQIRSDCRDSLLRHLIGHGVEAIVRYPVPIHLQPAFSDLGWREGEFPVAERLSKELLAIPIRPDMTEEEVQYVIQTIRLFFRGLRCAANPMPSTPSRLSTDLADSIKP